MRVSTVKKLNHIPMIFIFSVVFLFGLAFTVLSFTFLKKDVPEGFVECEATITEIIETEVEDTEYEYEVYIDYTFDGTEYKDNVYDKYDSSMKKGGKVKIFVNENNPQEYMSDPSDSFIFPLLGGIFAVIGLVGIIYNAKKLSDMKRSKEQ